MTTVHVYEDSCSRGCVEQTFATIAIDELERIAAITKEKDSEEFGEWLYTQTDMNDIVCSALHQITYNYLLPEERITLHDLISKLNSNETVVSEGEESIFGFGLSQRNARDVVVNLIAELDEEEDEEDEEDWD